MRSKSSIKNWITINESEGVKLLDHDGKIQGSVINTKVSIH